MTALIIDGRNALFRHAHANRKLATASGMPTGAVYGMLLGVCARRAELKASVVEVCWEAPTNWRKALWPGYKRRKPDAKRNDIVEAVHQQEPWAQELLALCGVRQWRPVDGEGDDALAARAHLWRGLHDVVVESGDDDITQLVSPGGLPPTRAFRGSVQVWRDNHLWDDEWVTAHLGVPPALVPDYKALVGDTSDCYPGCPGVGPAKARDLLAGGRVEPLLQRAARGEVPGAVGRKLVEHRDLVLLCRRLAELDGQCALEEIPPEPDPAELRALLVRLECHTLTTPHRLEALGRLGGG